MTGVQPMDSLTEAALDFDALYSQQWWPMVRIAQGLLGDVSAAEDVVQDAFTALYRKQDALRDQRAAIGYLRTSVVNGARSSVRKIIVRRRHLAGAVAEPAPAADHASLLDARNSVLRAAVAQLPDRQREVLTLRFVAGLDDSEIAEATGLSHGGVRSSASRGIAALRSTLRSTLGGEL